MPLVTRNVEQANVFKQAEEPPNWTNGDLWVDTDTAILSVNDSGTAVAVSDQTLDAQTSDHLTAGTVGQTLAMIRNTAIAGTTADTLMGKMEGATDGQTFAATGVTITDQSALVSTAESITTTETPPAGSFSRYNFNGDTLPANITVFETSPDSGSNFSTLNITITAGSLKYGECMLGAAARWRYTTPATVGTYLVGVMGASLS